MSVRLAQRLYPLAAMVFAVGGVTAVVAALPSGLAADAKLPVVAVTASSHDGNVPQNAIDGNLGTRWSAEGDPEWIQFDLGQSYTLGSVRLAWYQGNERQARFDVQVSAAGSSWTTVHSGLSSGTTTGLETVDFTDTAGRYLRVVGHGNTDNAWNSITEAEIFGAPPGGSQDLAVTAVTASSNDGNVPANTRDGNFGTRWSAEGDPEWIQFDLGGSRSLHFVWIAWYQGNERQARFDVQVSATGTSWTTVHTGLSSGNTTAFETVDFADTTGRYVRIVGHGNTDNDWNSITEVKIFGGGSTPTTGPTTTTTTTTPPPVGTDPNGIRQIYPSRTGKAAPWTLGFGDWQARLRPDGASISGSGKDTVLTNSGQVRISVEAVDSSCEGLSDHSVALQRGYMCSANDWYNVEFTGYVKLDTPASDAGDQDWTWYAGGGRHTGDGWEDGCMGSAYKGSYHYHDADVRFAKEQWHVNYDFKSWTSVPGGIDYTANRTRWLGMKYVKYQFTRNGQRGIRMELWLDLDGIDSAGNPRNNWQKVRTVEDHPDAGSWGGNAGECRAPSANQIMFWGGPWVTYRWDNTTSKLRLMSVREITPPAA